MAPGRSAKSHQMRLAFSISVRTSTNGAPIGSTRITMRSPRSATLAARRPGSGVLLVADPGATTSRSAAAPPVRVSRHRFSTPTMDSALFAKSRLTRRALLAGSSLLIAAERPNVLVFLTDQETALIPGPVNTPNRRTLEAQGVRFTHAFCNTPQRSPASSSLLPCLQPHQTDVLTNHDPGSLRN